jgi:hypothetical protein
MACRPAGRSRNDWPVVQALPRGKFGYLPHRNHLASDSLSALLGGPCEECCYELLANALAAMRWVDMDALQVGHPDRVHAARPAEPPGEVAHHLVPITRDQGQVARRNITLRRYDRFALR